MNKCMTIHLVHVERPNLGDWVKKCETCDGTGYIEFANSIYPDENDFMECGDCDGAGVIDTSSDTSDDYRESITEF